MVLEDARGVVHDDQSTVGEASPESSQPDGADNVSVVGGPV